MAALRGSMGSIDKIAPGDGRRVEFDQLHRYSVAAMGVAILAGLIAFMVASRANSPRDRTRI
jgi:hypothetical protein